MDGNIAAVVVAAVSAIPATIAAFAAFRTHKEVKTNHGVRAGARLEKLGDDMTLVKSVLAQQSSDTNALRRDFVEHAQNDLAFQERVEPFLTKEN